MFDILADLPLFRGVTHERIAATVGMAKFHFLKYAPGEKITQAGEACTHIKFIIAGSVTITIANSDDRFRITQVLDAPDVISPDFLFGSSTIYPGTTVANEETSIVQITKSDYMRVLASDSIFMFNFLNYLSMNAQKCIDGIISLTNGSIEERMALWVVALTQPTARDIKITCKHRDMYSMFGVQRSSFITALDHLQDKKALKYGGGEIEILDRRAMLGIMRNGVE